MAKIKVGTTLEIEGLKCQVIGFIVYRNPKDGNKKWTEYRLKTKKGEKWFSADDIYREYSISAPSRIKSNRIGPEWHKVDEGTQVVVRAEGDVDVDPGESAEFAEFEDSTEEKTLSLEIWSDGTEVSEGHYIEPKDIRVTGYEKIKSKEGPSGIWAISIWAAFIFIGVLGEILSGMPSNKKIASYLSKSTEYEYVTSITGSEKQKADVYEYKGTGALTEDVAKNIIDGVEGNTQMITESSDDSSITIQTKKEYCLVYVPEERDIDGDGIDDVLVQISNRKYNYTSDNTPYHASHITSSWYRSSYYSGAFSQDSSTWKHTPSAYEMYSGPTVHDMGNGYLDTYSGSVRQASIDARQSDSGGISSGK